MKIYNLVRYFLRFLILQTTITFVTIWYFDNFLIGDYTDGFVKIKDNLFEDRDRFYPFVTNDYIKIDIYLALFVFAFLVMLYLSKYYSYVNDLSFTVNKSIFDEFLPIYLIWTSSFLSFLQLFRFDEVSRFHTIILTLIIPIILVIFRNSEFISSVLGRNPTKENYIAFNLKSDSVFRELRIISLRNELANFVRNTDDFEYYKETIESFNKENEINIVVFDLSGITSIPDNFIKYLINLNKKILIIADSDFKFQTNLIYRFKRISNKNLFYLNNDIQYGSSYIAKRLLDLSCLVLFSVIYIPIGLVASFYILLRDGGPPIIKQTRVGLHGKNFNMYKFRTMKKDSHEERVDLETLNTHSGPLFKIENDPRIFKGGGFLRKYSIDEIPQLINVLLGEMSVVGPRPLFPEDNAHYNEHYIRRLNVMPGITGLLQINERNTDDFKIWYKYDLEYIENWNIFLDIKIILLTPFSLFKSKITGV
jgi:lipopolysaccharide/colanic/teichoic acid biosynthesis glycosyltransferase